MKILRKLCSEQVNILLDRMDTHAEEFSSFELVHGNRRWRAFITGGEWYEMFTPIEKFLVRQKLKKISARLDREKAYSEIIERLVNEPPKEDYLTISTIARAARNLELESKTKKLVVNKSMMDEIKKITKDKNDNYDRF